MARRVVAILNPRSDRGRTADRAAALSRTLAGRFELELRQTTRRGEAVELARDVDRSRHDVVLAIGGDGTVHEVVNGLMDVPVENRPPLAILPAGSGNDVAYALGISGDLNEAAARLEQGRTRPVDVALVEAQPAALGGATNGPAYSRYSINNVGLLLEGEVNLASHQLTWPRGSGLYLRAFFEAMLRPLPVAELDLVIDGQSLSRQATILSLGNGPRSGGKFLLVPDATIDDGRFDYLLAPPLGRARIVWEVAKCLRGVRRADPRVERGQFTSLDVQSNIPLAVHVDGEPWLDPQANIRHLAVTVRPRALAVVCN